MGVFLSKDKPEIRARETKTHTTETLLLEDFLNSVELEDSPTSDYHTLLLRINDSGKSQKYVITLTIPITQPNTNFFNPVTRADIPRNHDLLEFSSRYENASCEFSSFSYKVRLHSVGPVPLCALQFCRFVVCFCWEEAINVPEVVEFKCHGYLFTDEVKNRLKSSNWVNQNGMKFENGLAMPSGQCLLDIREEEEERELKWIREYDNEKELSRRNKVLQE